MAIHSLIIKNAQAVVNLGVPNAFSKATLISAINERAEEIRTAGESFAKAFTRAITEDEVGRTLYKASKTAEGPEQEQAGDAVQDFVSAPPSAGPAHDAMQRLADAHNQANPTKSPAQSYASVYSDPKNTALRQRVLSEHLAPRIAQDAADHAQSMSNGAASRNAAGYPGSGSVTGPHDTSAKQRTYQGAADTARR